MAVPARKGDKGIRLTRLNRLVIIASVLLCVAILAATVETSVGYRRMQQDMERHIAARDDAMLFEEGSTYLTDESRSFIMTGAAEHVFNFVEEIEVTRRRERMRDDAEYLLVDEDVLLYLDRALQYSNDLADVEMYAMRLMIDALGLGVASFPERIQAIALTDADAALDAAEKKEAAAGRLFDEDYALAKTLIFENVNKSINALVTISRERMIESKSQLDRLLTRQQVLLLALLISVLGIVLLNTFLVIRPIKRNIAAVDSRRSMDENGAQEMRRLARAYNELLAESREKHQELSYSATHDAVTGLYNRAAYEDAIARMDEGSIGMLIVDVDKFKLYNDTYGHETGDRVLRRVAQVLTESFRSEDHISRIGGDEFCVIMMRAGSALGELALGKVRRMNERLASGEEGLPPISVSVGIAFGDALGPEGDLFHAADAALYRVKGNGRGGAEIG